MTDAAACLHPSSAESVLFPAQDYITGARFAIVRCGLCGLARTHPQPSAGDLHKYYPSGYYGEAKRYPAPLQGALNWLYTQRATTLEAAAGRGAGKVLDIGCGQGYVLSALRARGWAVTGTELSEESARHAREALRLDVRVGDIQNLDLPGEAFDLIVMWHVLEHVPAPVAQLHIVSGLLKPGGLLLVAVPNFGSPEARWAKDRWFHLDVPRHLAHFDLPALRASLQSAGMTVERVSYFAPEYDFFSASQTALNMIGVRQNLLYNLIRSRGAKLLEDGGERPSARDLLATLVLTPLFGGLSLTWAPAAAWLGLGATMSVYARKTPSRSS